MKQGFLVSFGEIFLKSPGVQRIFKTKLIHNLSFFFKREKLNFRYYLWRERLFLETNHFRKAASILKETFGISWFAKSFFFDDKKDLLDFISQNYEKWIKKRQTFALRVKKGGDIKDSRREIIKEIASKINREVNLEKPDKKIFVEARKEGWYLYFDKKKGPGGLPVGSQGKVLSLISGGIDSPVASYLIAKRGAENVWLHFHSFPLVSRASIEKVKKLAQVFLKFQPQLLVYLFPFLDIQVEIKTKTIPKYYILLYRRAMLKIAQQIAKKEKCQAIVTGESLGQVSSQTLDNIRIIEEVTKLPILRPLIGMNKEEIIQVAKSIGTFEISILPQEDCCHLFSPPHSTGRGNLRLLKQLEEKVHLEKIVKEIWREVEILKFK